MVYQLEEESICQFDTNGRFWPIRRKLFQTDGTSSSVHAHSLPTNPCHRKDIWEASFLLLHNEGIHTKTNDLRKKCVNPKILNIDWISLLVSCGDWKFKCYLFVFQQEYQLQLKHPSISNNSRAGMVFSKFIKFITFSNKWVLIKLSQHCHQSGVWGVVNSSHWSPVCVTYKHKYKYLKKTSLRYFFDTRVGLARTYSNAQPFAINAKAREMLAMGSGDRENYNLL